MLSQPQVPSIRTPLPLDVPGTTAVSGSPPGSSVPVRMPETDWPSPESTSLSLGSTLPVAGTVESSTMLLLSATATGASLVPVTVMTSVA